MRRAAEAALTAACACAANVLPRTTRLSCIRLPPAPPTLPLQQPRALHVTYLLQIDRNPKATSVRSITAVSKVGQCPRVPRGRRERGPGASPGNRFRFRMLKTAIKVRARRDKVCRATARFRQVSARFRRNGVIAAGGAGTSTRRHRMWAQAESAAARLSLPPVVIGFKTEHM